MTRHHFTQQGNALNDRPVFVATGWDRMTAAYFLYAEYLDTEHPEEEFLFNDTFEMEYLMRGMTLGEVEQESQRLGLKLPDGLLEALRDDRAMNAGNQLTDWDQVRAPAQ